MNLGSGTEGEDEKEVLDKKHHDLRAETSRASTKLVASVNTNGFTETF